MEQTPDVRSEIARLNKIIDILTDQIGILKAENRFYKNKFGDKNVGNAIYFSDNGTPKPGTSIVEKGNTSPNVGSSNDFSDNGTPKLGTPIVEKGNTPSNVGTSIDFSDNGAPNHGTSIVEKGNTSPNVGTSNDFSDNGISNVGSPVSEKGNAISMNSSANAGKAPAFIEPSGSNAGKLERAIKRFFHIRTKGSKIRSFASQMLLLHNNHYAAYPEMRKVSGMSKAGFNKQAPDLRRKGFVQRASHQKYVLTEMSKQIIDKTFSS